MLSVAALGIGLCDNRFANACSSSKGCHQLFLQNDALLCVAIYHRAADGLIQRRHLVLDLLLALSSFFPLTALQLTHHELHVSDMLLCLSFHNMLDQGKLCVKSVEGMTEHACCVCSRHLTHECYLSRGHSCTHREARSGFSTSCNFNA